MTGKLLFLAPEFPWPAENGYRAKLAGLLTHLEREWDLIFGGQQPSFTSRAKVPDFGGQLIAVEPRPRQRVRGLVRGLLPSSTTLPWPVIQPRVEKLLRAGHRYEAVHLDTLRTAHLAGPLRRMFRDAHLATQIIASPNDSYSLLLRSNPSYQRRALSPLVRPIERSLLREPDVVDAVSQRDVEWLRSKITTRRVRLIPLGVDVCSFRAPRLPAMWDVLYVGGIAGVERWLREFLDIVVPGVRARHPQVRVAMAGPVAPDWLIGRCRSQRIIHLGFVDDLSSLLRSSRMLVVPSDQIAGTPTKALEAMAAGTPVVGRAALDGIVNGEPGVSHLRASEWSEMVHLVDCLLHDEDLARRIGEGGRQLVEREHNWPEVVRRYCAFDDEVPPTSHSKR